MRTKNLPHYTTYSGIFLYKWCKSDFEEDLEKFKHAITKQCIVSKLGRSKPLAQPSMLEMACHSALPCQWCLTRAKHLTGQSILFALWNPHRPHIEKLRRHLRILRMPELLLSDSLQETQIWYQLWHKTRVIHDPVLPSFQKHGRIIKYFG